jgi:hypothetical protein
MAHVIGRAAAVRAKLHVGASRRFRRRRVACCLLLAARCLLLVASIDSALAALAHRQPSTMRRIARPARALDAARPLHPCARPRLAATPCLSTASARAFLLPAGKQDKKKHQQFVRRWQKRLLGDSEPIGAHVDPYDPSSPVRIAPEDQGEELEVLDDDSAPLPVYTKASHNKRLMHVGGEQWLAQRSEVDMAREFEKLTLRTYTPLSLQMADDIEDLTGTPYTLADDNLMLAQTVHTVTARPYTRFK